MSHILLILLLLKDRILKKIIFSDIFSQAEYVLSLYFEMMVNVDVLTTCDITSMSD